MSMCEGGIECALPWMMTSFLQLNAFGRYTSVRLGMSNHHFKWMGITFENDVTNITECLSPIPFGSE